MIRKSLALIPVIAVLLFGFSLGANAQTLHYVNQIGSVNGSLAISVTGNSWDTGDPTLAPQISGTINISGNVGSLGLSVSAGVGSMFTDTTKIGSRTYKRTRLVSQQFSYVDLNTRIHTTAIMQATIINYSRGTITFQIVDVATGATLAATGTPDGQITPLTLTTGSTSIN